MNAEIVPKNQTQLGGLTIHEIWHENREVAFPCVFIDQQAVVDKFPAESIRNNDNDSRRTSALRGIRNIGGQAVESYYLASRFCVLSFRASEAIGTSHSADGSWSKCNHVVFQVPSEEISETDGIIRAISTVGR